MIPVPVLPYPIPENLKLTLERLGAATGIDEIGNPVYPVEAVEIGLSMVPAGSDPRRMEGEGHDIGSIRLQGYVISPGKTIPEGYELRPQVRVAARLTNPATNVAELGEFVPEPIANPFLATVAAGIGTFVKGTFYFRGTGVV